MAILLFIVIYGYALHTLMEIPYYRKVSHKARMINLIPCYPRLLIFYHDMTLSNCMIVGKQ